MLLIHSLTRAARICAITAALGLAVQATPVLAAEGAPEAKAAPAKDEAKSKAEAAAAQKALALWVKEKALFSAEMAPTAVAIIRANEGNTGYSRMTPENIIDTLWFLRIAPDLQKEWIDKLRSPQGSDREKRKALREFFDLQSEARSLTRRLRENDEYAELKKRRHAFDEKRWKDRNNDYTAEEALLLLDEAKYEDQTLAKALAVLAIIKREQLDSYDLREYVHILVKLQPQPEDLKLAVSLLKNKSVEDGQRRQLMAKLVTSPAVARNDIKKLAETQQLQTRYMFAIEEESLSDLILLPLETVVPDAVKAVKKGKAIPLAASTFGWPQSSLSFERLDTLVPEEFTGEDEKGDSVPLPFLNPGERLYVIERVREGSVFTGTPLDSLSYSGPGVLEYTLATRRTFLRRLRESNSRSNYGFSQSAFIAAACGPEELAAHLASLSVMQTAREKSLYGPYEDYVWKASRWDRYSKNLPDVPKDIPGEAIRLVRITDAALFTALAPVADAKGLPRLMGPIRGVWTQQKGGKPWAQLRYAPGKKDGATPAALGKDPILSLGKDALKAVAAAKEMLVLEEWAYYSVRERRTDDTPITMEEALAETKKRFDALRAKGFTSPWDMGAITYILERCKKDPALLEKLQAILDDTTLSPAKRLAAMDEASKEARTKSR